MEDERIVFFDGDCLLCQASLKWLNRLDVQDRLVFAPLQGSLAKDYAIDRSEDSMAFVEGGQIWRSSDAVRKVCRTAGGAGVLLWAILTLVPRPIREFGYRLVASYRKSFPGSRTCDLPEEGMKEKMRA